MADDKREQTKVDAKVNYSSTVFACDLSSDNRYIRCDFPQCSEHGSAVQAKPSWMLNTLKNVRTLESHVGKEVHNFMKAQPLQCVFSDTQHKIESQKIIESCRLPTGAKKVLAVFNLKDSQSQLGEWLDFFLKAAFLAEYGDKRRDFVVITQDFVSRYDLMQCIARLEFIKSYSPKVEVISVLSCHSSCQGQVFSCTPSNISKVHGFEEFCSLHDVTLTCQDTFGDNLVGLHISSCFTLKLDCSHNDWPVDAIWFKNKLKCVLTGSTREVYETGSQICDLHLLITTVLSPPIASFTVESCGERLRKAVFRAKTEEFPDLAREMGLEVISGQSAGLKLQIGATNDKVSPPGLVVSEVFVALLVEQDTSSNNPDNPTMSKLLADAITANLSIRKASDIRCTFMVLPVTIDKVSSLKTKSSLKEKLKDLPRNNSKVFFVVLSPSLANPSTGLIEAIRGWSTSRGGDKIYGVHFQEISALQAYYIKNRLKEEVALSKYNRSVNTGEESDIDRLEHIAIIGLVDNSDKNPHVSFPVLMYLIHLAIGENGERLAGKGIPSGVYSKKPAVGPGTSCWTLEEVYMETCHVLSGLARKCLLQVLSLPVTEPTASNSPCVQSTTTTNDNVSIPVCITGEKRVTLQERKPICPSKVASRRDSPSFDKMRRCIKEVQKNVTSKTGSSEMSTRIELIDLTPKKEKMSSAEKVITRVIQDVYQKDGRVSRKRSIEYEKVDKTEESPAKRLANSLACSSRTSCTLSNNSSPISEQGEIIQTSTTNTNTDLQREAPPTCFRNLTDDFERESKSNPHSSLIKTDIVCHSSTSIPGRIDIDSCAANMRSSNKCSGVNKALPKPVKASLNNKKVFREFASNLSPKLSSEDSSTTERKKVVSSLEKPDINVLQIQSKTHEVSSDCLAGEEQIGHVPMEMEAVKISVDSNSIDDSNDSLSNHEVGVIDDDLVLEMSNNLEGGEIFLDEKRTDVDYNSKSTQAVFSVPLDKDKNTNTIKQCIIKKIRRLKTQNICTSSEKQEKTEKKRKLLSQTKFNCKSEKLEDIDGAPPDDKGCKLTLNNASQSGLSEESISKAFESAKPQTGSTTSTIPSEKSQDVPLMANVDEVHVTHYVLDLAVDFEEKVMRGSIVLFMEPANEEVTNNTFQLCLDSTLVNVESVCEVFLPNDFKIPFFWRKSSTERSCSGISVETDTAKISKDNTNNVIKNSKNEGVSSYDQKSEETKLSETKDCIEISPKGTELSLFQRLQKNYGIGPKQNDLESSMEQPELLEENNDSTASEDMKSHRDTEEESLPEFMKLLGAKASDPLPYKGLTYSVYGWCIKVWKEEARGEAWPRCVCIKYHTSPEGQSLMWTTDQDGKPCVFSPGAYINNRSLMPCQEPPVAMSTWQAAIHVPRGCMAYMSGCPVTVEDGSPRGSDLVTHYFEMDIALPCSTLALAVGWLPYREGPKARVPTKEGSHREIPCRIVAAPSLIDRAADQLLQHMHTYIEAACELLGQYPFDRLDLLILPRCFACMGLKSPNLAFLSQSILASDGSLRLRVAHEISHAWFGLLIGAKDWTEEWLSEGFATYMEDTIQSKGEKWLEHQDQQRREIRQILRYRTLSSEMRETERNMQCLRPKITKFNVVEMAEEPTTNNSGDQPKPSSIIKYKCSKKWTQVHYLKGYFLLNHLANLVGREKFDRFLYDYVQHYQGQLVNSEDFFDFFTLKFPAMISQTVESIMEEWLERPGIPKCLRRKAFANKENVLVNQALEEFEFWRRQDTTNKRNRTKNARHRKEPENYQLETSEQIVLMLEKLLERDSLLHTTLRQLNKSYQFDTLNAEIRHRWCELVVKHKFTPALKDVRQFLIEDQGMGIYLFGELIISGQGKQRLMAEEIFAEIGNEMDRCTYKTVSDMLAGVE